MQNQIGLLRLGPATEDGQDYVIPTQLRRTRVGQTAVYELAHLAEQPTSLVGNRSSHLYWNFKADLLTKPTELKSQPSSWSMLTLKEGADAAVTQNTQISPFEAGEHFITQLCINVEEKLKQTLGSDIKLSFLFTSPGYEQTESQTYKQNIRRILRKIVKTNLLKQSNFPQLTGGESFLYEQYGIYHYFSQCEKRIDLGIPKANYLIIDIGGSTTDIALVHLTKSGEVARVFPIYESFQYGGSNFNESILKYVIPEDAAYHSYDSERKSKILSLIEKAKLEILSSKNPEHSKSLKSSGSVYKFTREIIDQAFDRDWNWKIKKNILKVLSTAENDKRITYEGESFKVDGILLAGGTSKLERFRENLQTDPEIGKYFSQNYTISYATQADPSSLASLGLGISIMERSLKGQEGEVESGLPQAEEIYFKVKDNNGNPLKIHRRIHRNGDSRSLLFTLEQLMKAAPEKDNSRIHFPRDLFSDADIEKLPESVTIEFTTDCNSNPQVLSLLLGEPPDIGRNNPTGLCFSTAVDRPNVRSSEISPTKIRIDPYFYRYLPLSKEYRRCDKKDKFSKIDISLASTGISLEEKRAYVCVDFGMNNTSVAVFAPEYHLNDQDFKVLDISSVEDTLAEHGKIPIPTIATEIKEDRKLSVVIDGTTYQVIKEITKHPSTQLPVYLAIHNEENFIVNRIDSQSRQYKKIPIGKFTNQIQLSAEQAISLLDLPRFLGVHPQTGAAVGIKPTTEGLNLIHGDFDILPFENWELAQTITFEEALELLPQYVPDSLLPHFLGVHPDTGAPIEIVERSEGPTLIHGTFDSVPLLGWQQAQTITLEEALELLPVYEPLVPLEEPEVEDPTSAGQGSSIYLDLKESLDALADVLRQQSNQNSEILEALLKIVTQPLPTSPKDPEPNETQSTQLPQKIELRQKDNSFQNSFSGFEEFVIEAGFSYESSVLRQVWAHSQNQNSRLAILAGPPGSGKTQLVSLLARYFNRDLTTQSHHEEFHLLEPVLPSWFSSENLLGFYSQITQQFHPTKFFDFIKRAEHYYLADVERLFFVCLDEFNLAQPEQYLANILSVMESESAEMTVCQETGQSAFISHNLKLFATINTDSASKALSPKVLDRSVLIRVTPSKDKVIEFSKNKTSSIAFASRALKNFHNHLDILYELGTNSGSAFGFRTIDTAINYLESHPYSDIEDANLTDTMLTEAVDEIISSAFLSKLPGFNRFEGEEDYKKTLDKAFNQFQQAKLVHSKKIVEKIKSGYPGQSAF